MVSAVDAREEYGDTWATSNNSRQPVKKKYTLILPGVLALLPQKSSMINKTKLFTDFTQQIYNSGTSVQAFTLNHIGLHCNEDYYLKIQNQLLKYA